MSTHCKTIKDVTKRLELRGKKRYFFSFWFHLSVKNTLTFEVCSLISSSHNAFTPLISQVFTSFTRLLSIYSFSYI